MKYSNETDFNAANKFGKGNANTAFAQYFIGKSFLNPAAATIGTFTTQARAAGRF